MSNIVEIKVPDIGDFDTVEVIEILVAVGDTIEAEQSLITVESDKASMEIPASQGGVVKALKVKLGDKVSEGSVILEVEASGAAAATVRRPPPLRPQRPRPCRRARLRPRHPPRRPPRVARSPWSSPTSATSTRSKSSRSWSPRAIPSRPSKA